MESEVREFYNKYGIREWNRLEENIYSKINFLLHMNFIENHLHKGIRILDAGCGAGRYSIEFAKRGCQVTLFDISDEQLKIAEEKIGEAKVQNNIDEIILGDIRDLSYFNDGQFDIVVCYGAPLSYILDHREKAIQGFHRVLKKEGKLFVSVNNKWGILKMLLGTQYPDFFSNPEYWFIDKVMDTGDLPKHEKVNQPARHFFEAAELDKLLSENGFQSIFLGGSPCFSCGSNTSIEKLCKNEATFHTIMQIELATYTKRTMVDHGEFLLAKGVKDVKKSANE